MPLTDQGVDPTRYTVIPRTLIFLTRGDQVLLLRGAPHKKRWAGLYNGLGGHVEQGEDIYTSARRELFEETGLSVSDLWLSGVLLIDTGNPGILVFVLRGEGISGDLSTSHEGVPEWMRVVDGFSHLPLVEDLPLLLPRVLAPNPTSPFVAHYTYDEAGRLQITFLPR